MSRAGTLPPPWPDGEAGRLWGWLEERGLRPQVHPALQDGGPVLVVRVLLPGLRGLSGDRLDRDDLWWPVTPDGVRVLLHPDVHEALAWWVERVLAPEVPPARAHPTADLSTYPPAPGPVATRRWQRARRPDGKTSREVRPAGGWGRFVVLMLAFALVLALLLPALRTVRDWRSEGRAEEAAALLADAVADEVAGTGTLPDEAGLARLLDEAVPGDVRAMRGRYAKGDLAVGWLVPFAERPDGTAAFELCVEMRSLAGDEAYAAAWAGTEGQDDGWVTRTRRGAGCGDPPTLS